jgi:hypothetical protein
MALSALKRKFAEQFLGHGSQHGNPHGAQHGVEHGKLNGALDGAPDVCPDSEPQFHVAGDRLVSCPPGRRPVPDPSEYAAEFLTWLRREYPAPREQLWVAAQDFRARALSTVSGGN